MDLEPPTISCVDSNVPEASRKTFGCCCPLTPWCQCPAAGDLEDVSICFPPFGMAVGFLSKSWYSAWPGGAQKQLLLAWRFPVFRIMRECLAKERWGRNISVHALVVLTCPSRTLQATSLKSKATLDKMIS